MSPDGYGGVMIAISKQINSHEITALETICELLWTQVSIGNSNKLIIICDLILKNHPYWHLKYLKTKSQAL